MLQVKPQVVPSQLGAPLVGVAHGVHELPHELVLLLGWQVPLQSWVPIGQTPAHDAVLAMHAPAQSFMPVGQVPPHTVPSQVAVPPPVGAVQAMQAEPHELTDVLRAQVDPQR